MPKVNNAIVGEMDLLHKQLAHLREIYSKLNPVLDDQKTVYLSAFFDALVLNPGDLVQFETDQRLDYLGFREIFVSGEIRPDVYRNLLAKLGEVDE